MNLDGQNIIKSNDIKLALNNIRPFINETPLVTSRSLSNACKAPIFLKLEHHQRTGSFKIRGASNAILNLPIHKKEFGVVGVSTGNHGKGLAAAAKEAQIKCIICMSQLVPKNKIEGIESLGAEVRIIGDSQDDAQVEVDRLVEKEGMTMIPPFDHKDIIAGQGTLGIEILHSLPDVELALIPVSGGGLISGVSVALKSAKPKCRIIGISMERGAAMYESQKVGKPILVTEEETLADSLGGGIGLDNRYTFQMTRDLVDDFVLVSETEISEAIHHAYWQESQIVEGSGAVSLAALISNKVKPKGVTVALMCGGNIDMKLHHRIVSKN